MILRPPLAVTSGDPAGIGIEVFLAAQEEIGQEIPIVWFGDSQHLPREKSFTNWSPEKPKALGSGLYLYQIDFKNPAVAGNGDPGNALGVIKAIETATNFAKEGKISGLCTAPISKKILKEGANFNFPGHTEYLAHLCGVKNAVMMLSCPQLRVVPLTIHIPISDVVKNITKNLFERTVEIIHSSLILDFGIKDPKISVAGLNPHASERGSIGNEDVEYIRPWITQLQSKGISIFGPNPADTMFHFNARSQYDVALCMYHDQALIPLKTLDFYGGTNITLGLPIVRTSPDHGTAFDIAGQGIANKKSMVEAIRAADLIIKARHNAN